MKNVLKAIGIIALLLVLYFAAQSAVTFILGIIHAVQMVFRSAVSNGAPDVSSVTEELMRYIGGQTPLVLLVAVAATTPLYYLIYRGRRQELWTFVRFGRIDAVSVPVLIVFGLAVNVLVELLLALLGQVGFLKDIFKSYDQIAKLITGGGFVLSLLAVGIVGPIFEELLFRGLVFGELRKVTRVRVAIVLQALLFGVYHMNIVQGSYAFLIGLLLGYIYYRSSTIVAPMIVHITINSSSVILSQVLSGNSDGTMGGAVIIAGVLLFVLTGGFILTHRSFRHAMDDGLYEQSRGPRPQLPPEQGGQN